MNNLLDPLEIAKQAMRRGTVAAAAAVGGGGKPPTKLTAPAPPPAAAAALAAPAAAATVPAAASPAPAAPPPPQSRASPPASVHSAVAVAPPPPTGPATPWLTAERWKRIAASPVFYFALTFAAAFGVLATINPAFVQVPRDASKPSVPGEDRPCSFGRVLVWATVMAAIGALIPLVGAHWEAIAAWVSQLRASV